MDELNKNNHVLLGKTARTLAILTAMAAVPYAIPELARYRALVSQSQSTERDAEIDSLDITASETKRSARPGEIEDPSGRALDAFFEALHRTETEGAQTRVCHYGDSPITNDGITSTVRRKLQLRFGDAGHGFILIARPWGWYNHEGVRHEATRGWRSDPMWIGRGDHFYGLGGASFTAIAGERASFSTAERGDVGRSVSAFDIYFLRRPGGGEFDIEVDGIFRERISTAGDKTEPAFHRVEVGKGAHTLTLITASGEVRLFGIALDSNERGVQYDSLGVNGAFIGLLANYLDADHWAEQLQHRDPQLVIIGYGANESQFERLQMDQYERDTREVIKRIRAALPRASIMLVGPMDRGQRGAGGQIITRKMIMKLISYQRRIAAETGCAFFDTFSAMGGEGTVARWHESKPRLMGGDLTHPTAQGAEIVGSLIYDAIIKAYEVWSLESGVESRF
ncbi:MAG: GDSL-type esterase/lipase family protein [Acidobacteriota bacterium]